MTYAFHPERDGDLHARALTLATNLLYGLRGALNVLREEGPDNVFRRHDRHAEPTCRVVHTCGLEILWLNPAEYSSSLTAVLMPDGRNEAEFCKVVLDNFNMSLRSGLGKVART
jgi:alanine-glyoxylate transaminase/serine-glyoxylate transaminase/serine-pyruvate transaminase